MFLTCTVQLSTPLGKTSRVSASGRWRTWSNLDSQAGLELGIAHAIRGDPRQTLLTSEKLASLPSYLLPAVVGNLQEGARCREAPHLGGGKRPIAERRGLQGSILRDFHATPLLTPICHANVTSHVLRPLCAYCYTQLKQRWLGRAQLRLQYLTTTNT